MPSKKSLHSSRMKKEYDNHQKTWMRIYDACSCLFEGRPPFEVASKLHLSRKAEKHKQVKQDDIDDLKWKLASLLSLICNCKCETPRWIINEDLDKVLYYLANAEIPGYLAIVNKSDIDSRIKKLNKTQFKYSNLSEIFDGLSDPFKSINSFSKSKKRELLRVGQLVEKSYPGHILTISNRQPFPNKHYCSIKPKISIDEGGEPIVVSKNRGRPKNTDTNLYGHLMNLILTNFTHCCSDQYKNFSPTSVDKKVSVTLAAKECNKLLKKIEGENTLNIKIVRSIESLKDAYEDFRKNKTTLKK